MQRFLLLCREIRNDKRNDIVETGEYYVRRGDLALTIGLDIHNTYGSFRAGAGYANMLDANGRTV